MQQAVVVMQNHIAIRAWWAWQDFLAHQQQARDRASHALALMLRQTQARAFNAWQVCRPGPGCCCDSSSSLIAAWPIQLTFDVYCLWINTHGVTSALPILMKMVHVALWQYLLLADTIRFPADAARTCFRSPCDWQSRPSFQLAVKETGSWTPRDGLCSNDQCTTYQMLA